MSTETYRFPNLLALLPKKKGGEINPHFQAVNSAFNAWVEKRLGGFHAVAREVYECESPLGMSLACPLASYQQLKGIVDYTAAAFMLDDLFDRGSVEELAPLSQLWLKIISEGGEVKSVEHPLIEMMRSDLLLGIKTAVGSFHWSQFVEADKKMVMHMIQEAHDQKAYPNKNETLTIQSYIMLRRWTVGTCVYFTFIRLSRCLCIPDDVLANPSVQEMESAATLIVLISNDLYSFKKEYSCDGASNNILTAIEKDPETAHLDFQGRLDHAEKMFKEALARFHACRRALPSFGPEMDEYLSQYADGLMDLAAGNLQWSRVVRRYSMFKNDEDRKNHVIRIEKSQTAKL